MKTRPGFLMVVVTVAMLAWTSVARGDPLERWYWRNPLPQGNVLHNVVFVDGKYIAVGELGTILISNDGTNWLRQTSGTAADLRDCAYGVGKYVVIGDFGTVLTSIDAVDWVPQYAGTFYSLNGITYAGGQFVTVGEQSVILTSPDGSIWTQRSSGSWQLLDIIYAGGLFVAAGGDAATANDPAVRVLLTSTDANVWTYRVLESAPPFVSLAFGAGTFAAVTPPDYYYGSSALWTSTNGIDWQPNPALTTPYLGSGVSFGNGKWIVAAGDTYSPGTIHVSDDLQIWVEAATNTRPISGITYGGGKFLASRTDGTFLISSNGLSWANPLPEPTIIALTDLTYLNGVFWGLGYNQFAFSTDGVHWTNAVAPTNTGPLLSITYGNGRYVAGGEYRTVWTSTDGLNWTNPAPALSIYPYIGDVVVTYGNGVFVGASGFAADILTSADGLDWTVQQLQTNAFPYVYFTDITFGNGRFVAVSAQALATSTDGTNWFLNVTNQNIQSVVSGNGRFVGVGYNTIATSTDGTNWIAQSSSAFGPLGDVAFGAGLFIATTTIFSSGTAIKKDTPIWVSNDGIHWSKRSSKTPGGLSPVAFGNGTFVIGAQNGGILQSDPLVTLNMSMQSHPRLLLSGPLNRSYQIESIDVLGQPDSWSPLATITATNDPVQFIDTSWTNSMKRFYRAVLLP